MTGPRGRCDNSYSYLLCGLDPNSSSSCMTLAPPLLPAPS
uniref:Uncharacterized protein n=1 Tax=Anguilla anguilla TaxID=7936 RepID=A0A0E9V7E6_ANGAN